VGLGRTSATGTAVPLGVELEAELDCNSVVEFGVVETPSSKPSVSTHGSPP
jgi:hypothetical protein